MKEDLMLQKLRAWRAPTPDPSNRERALHRARIAFDHGVPERGRRFGILWQKLIVSAGAFAVVAIFLIGKIVTPRQEIPDLLAKEALWRQFETIFPNHLLAVVERDDNVDVELASKSMPQTDQGILVTLRDKGRTVNILSFSGGNVCLDIRGRQLCFEMLITDTGDVILSGKDFVWTSARAGRLVGCEVEARALERQL